MEKSIELYDKSEPAFNLIVQGYNLFDKYQTNKHRKVVTAFHRNILDGNATQEKINYEKELIKVNQDDYYILLKYAVQDEETEKADIYSNIYKYIRDNQHIEQDTKRLLIRTAKDLPSSAIKLLPKIYIYKNYHTKSKSINSYLEELYISHGYETGFLENYNLIQRGSGSFGPLQYSVLQKTFNPVINAFFSEEELLPQTHNIDLWKDKIAAILSDDPFGEEHPIDLIKNILKKESILVEVMTYQNINFDNYAYIICVVTPNNILKIDKFDNLQSNTKVIKTSISTVLDGTSILHLNREEDIQKFKDKFSD